MIRAAKVVCWLFLVLSLVSIGALYRMNPTRALGGSLATLLPFLFALVALYSEPRQWKTWTAIVLNGLLAVIGIVLLAFAPQAGKPLVAAVAGVVFVLASALIIAGVVVSGRKPIVADSGIHDG